MAKKSTDYGQLVGALEKHGIRLDSGLLQFVRDIGGGDLALGVRRCIVGAFVYREQAGTLPASGLLALRNRWPERAAAYYAAHPEQVTAPHQVEAPDAYTRRSSQALMNQTKYEMLTASPLRPDAQEQPEPDDFADWD